MMTAERLKAFTDAVVAIAMTLLILPLMDSVSELGREGATAAEWVAAQSLQLFTFGLTFAIIASFWVHHHRLFDQVHNSTNVLVWLTMAWMATIVCLPVATAIVGLRLDAIQKIIYIGTLLAASLMLLVIRLYVVTHPGLHRSEPRQLRNDLADDIITSALLVVALIVSLAVPRLGFLPLFLLVLVWPLHWAAIHIMDRRSR